ncbi:MAG: DUF4870 domain-containing protein [Calditrichaeota bacterium]|nr:MAG: DUF4870 domain-containing protein [Calditrichota bacterium]
MEQLSDFREQERKESGSDLSSSDERTWGMLCHLAAFAGYFIPLGNIFGPLLVWMMKKEQSGFVDVHGKESLNFQISMTIYVIVASILTIILIGLPVLIGLLVFDLVVVIIASVKARDGEFYRYPLCIRFIT